MTYEYALVPVSATHAARIPLPLDQTPAQREAYLARVPADVLAAAERWPLPVASTPVADAPAAPTAVPPDAPDAGDEE